MRAGSALNVGVCFIILAAGALVVLDGPPSAFGEFGGSETIPQVSPPGPTVLRLTAGSLNVTSSHSQASTTLSSTTSGSSTQSSSLASSSTTTTSSSTRSTRSTSRTTSTSSTSQTTGTSASTSTTSTTTTPTYVTYTISVAFTVYNATACGGQPCSWGGDIEYRGANGIVDLEPGSYNKSASWTVSILNCSGITWELLYSNGTLLTVSILSASGATLYQQESLVGPPWAIFGSWDSC